MASMTVDATKTPAKNSKFHLDISNRKLPRPIVFWSDNEKDAFRRNRVVQTRLNMIVDDISNQRESSRRNIRYEAHKFRQKNGKYFQHPAASASSADSQLLGYVTSTPMNSARSQRSDDVRHDVTYNSSEIDSSDDIPEESPRVPGIITRTKKPAVKFSSIKQVYSDVNIEGQGHIPSPRSGKTETVTPLDQIRSASAFAHRDVPQYGGSSHRRQKSAFPSLRSRNSPENRYSNDARPASSVDLQSQSDQGEQQLLRSETFFDKSKAAYLLRQDLRRMARIRKLGVVTTAFTLQDALNLEREKYVKSSNKVEEYIKRLEAEKVADLTLINQWTRPALESRS